MLVCGLQRPLSASAYVLCIFRIEALLREVLHVAYHNVQKERNCHATCSLSSGHPIQLCCAVPFDLILNLRRLKQLIKKSTVEEEREFIEKALRKSEMLEVSEDGQLIHNRDIKSEAPSAD